MSKFVVYTVRGQDSSGSFETYRRYSDFMALRTVLVRKWPGVYIPAIPPKQILVSGYTGQSIDSVY
jgi:sorting nexin-1/2/sorting nexin-4